MMNTKISTNQLVMFALSLGLWWLLLGSIEMALGFFALIFVHEMGHVIAAKQKGLSVTMPTFTPFGAYVQTERCRSASDEAYIKFAGPFLGGLASLVTMVAGAALGNGMMIQVGVFGVFLNLFNLIPLDPMDGGGMTQAISKWFWIPGAALLAYVLIFVAGANVFNLIMKRRTLAGSMIGGIPETQEMLDFCAEHGIVSDIELIRADEINVAYERMLKGDVKYRFVIDSASLGASCQ